MAADPPVLPASSAPQRSPLQKWGISAAVGCTLCTGLWYVKTHPPAESSLYPSCLFHSVTGLHCPGCGATRCVHALLNLRFVEAAHQNLLFLLLLPLIVFYAGRSWWRWLHPQTIIVRPPPRLWMAWTFLIVTITFGVVRNLPWAPFPELAPR